MICYRSKNMVIGCILFLLIISHITLSAQVQKPKIFVTISPKTVIVGQAVNVKVSVVVPTWLLGAPEFPQLEIPGAIAILPEERAENITQTIEGETWSGIARTYLIYPQEEKEYKFPKANIQIVYSLGGINKSPKTNLQLPQYKFNAVIPEEAKSLDYFLATTQLKATQKFDRKLSDLKVGDSFSRTIRVDVKNTMAMFIPPIQFDSLNGIIIYHDPAEVKNKSENRYGFTGGYRIEKTIFFIQEAGDYELPEVEIKWWNLNKNRIIISKIKQVKFHADSNANYISEIAIPEDSTVVKTKSNESSKNSWKFPTILILLFLIIYTVEKKLLLIEKFRSKIVCWKKDRKEQKENSEKAYFKRFQSACDKDDLLMVKSTFTNWLRIISSSKKMISIKNMAELTNNSKLLNSVSDIDTILYGNSVNSELERKWNSKIFCKIVKKSRENFLKLEKNKNSIKIIPTLNPSNK